MKTNHQTIKTGLFCALIGAALTDPATALATKKTVKKSTAASAKSDSHKQGLEIARKLDQKDVGWTDEYESALVKLMDAKGRTTSREYRRISKEGRASDDKSIARFLSPADIKGVAVLIHQHAKSPDDSWLYLPSNRRVRRISGANRAASFQGTEFTYEDLSGIDVDRYRWQLVESTTLSRGSQKLPCYRLIAIPKDRDTGYSRLELLVNKDKWRTEKIDFYDLSGKFLKTLTKSKWKMFHGKFWRAGVLSMKNHQTHRSTDIQTQKRFVNLSQYKKKDGTPRASLKDSHFTKRELESK